jgi:integrase
MASAISGILTCRTRPIYDKIEFPNVAPCQSLSSRDRGGRNPLLPETVQTMPIKRKAHRSSRHAGSAPPAPLADLLIALDQASLPAPRLRDLCSAVRRIADLLGDEPAHIALDLPAISSKLASINPVAVGVSIKTLANLRSGFLAAVKLSGLKPVPPRPKAQLSQAWLDLVARLSGKRAHLGLSRFAHYASANDIAPSEVNDVAIQDFIAAVRDGSLHRQPNVLHRQVTLIWNEVAKLSGFPPVTVASFRAPVKRIDWALLPDSFRKDVEDHLQWCGGTDVFAADARSRALAPRTVKLRRNQIHAAVTALVESGIKRSTIRSLSNLIPPENFKRILRQRLKTAGGGENAFNRDLAEALVQIAREWVKVDASSLAELKRLTSKLPLPASGLTAKNKASLRQFDDPEVLRRLINLPPVLWAEVKRETNPNFRTLAKAQAALAIGCLSFMPLRRENLTGLTYGVHLFLGEGSRATSTLEMPAGELKNDIEVAFDIPPHVAKMLIEYRDTFAPKVIGHRPGRVFVNADGSPKSASTVAWLIKAYLRRRAGIVLSPHQFRHLCAKIMLDAAPGNFEAVGQLLAHKNRKTTSNFYAGIDTRRAARHHQRLIERALEPQKPTPRPRRKGRSQ